jgi:tetratricopeptide (TPR) repeat protein
MTIRRPEVQITFAPDDGRDELHTELGQRGRLVLAGMLLVTLTLLTYLPALRGKFILSDSENITTNLALRSWRQGVSAIWLHPARMPEFGPIAYTLLLVESKLFGMGRPAGFHGVSILIHAANVLLLWTLLRRLDLSGALAAAAVFAVHPALVDSVAWISQQRILLGSALYLGALSYGLQWAGVIATLERGNEPSILNNKRTQAICCLTLFLLASLSHPACVTLPLALGAIVWWKRGALRRTDMPGLILLVSMALVALAAAGVLFGVYVRPDAMEAGRQMWREAVAVVMPIRPRFAFAPPVARAGSPLDLAAFAALAVSLAACWMLRGRLGRAPFAAALLFVVLTLPEFLFGHGTIYLAAAAIIVPVVSFASRQIVGLARASVIRTAVASAAVCALAVLALMRIPAFASEEALWSMALAHDRTSIEALNRLGSIELRQKRAPDIAMRHFTRVLEAAPDNRTALLGVAEAYAARGDANKAMMQYLQVLQHQPDDADARLGLGLTLNLQGQSTAALAEFQRVLSLRPRDARAHLYVGRIHQFHGENDEAEKWYRMAIELDPFDPDAFIELAMVRYYFHRDIKQAEELIVQAMQIDPRNAAPYLNLGVMQFDSATKHPDLETRKRMIDEAANYLGQAALLDPHLAVAFKNRAIALGRRSQLADDEQERTRYLNQAIDAMERAAELGDDEARQAVPSLRRDRDRSQMPAP